MLADYCLQSTEHSEGERPMSTVSTVSSGSSGEGQYSLFNASHCAHSVPYQSTGTDISLELSPTESQFNNNASTVGVRMAPLHRASPVASVAMAPNSQLTYMDRVVMEIIETERMYVSDLRSIVSVSGFRFIFCFGKAGVLTWTYDDNYNNIVLTNNFNVITAIHLI